MTRGKLEGIDVDQLRERVAEVPADGRAVARLVASIEYKLGTSPARIERKYGWPEGTVYNWLEYLETRGIERGLRDAERPGRPPKLTDAQRRELHSALAHPPGSVGFDAAAWDASLVRAFIRDQFGIEYSLRHARRLL